jgi:Calcineurin-like phosphoesterase
MKLALFADIHSNLEAFTACMAHAQALGADRYAFLGDLVGYGADPVAVLNLIEQHAAKGAVAILGNHDAAALGRPDDSLNSSAQAAIAWTQTQLGERQRAFLAGLPLTVRDDNMLFVHASAAAPGEWTYVTDPTEAEKASRPETPVTSFAGTYMNRSCTTWALMGDRCPSGRYPGPPSLSENTANGWRSSAPPANHGTVTIGRAMRCSTSSGPD